MYLSEIKIWNFRKFGEEENNEPGLDVTFNSGLNLLVGENDSGKTAIIDAIKYVLFTQSYEYYRLEDEDFYISNGAEEESRATELKIECTFKDFDTDEAKNFLEWMHFEKNKDGNDEYILKVVLKGKRENGRIYRDVKAGNDEHGTTMDGKARDLLRIVYLKPLRDAEFELNPRKNSRLSQILHSHKDFADKEKHPIKEIVNDANQNIEDFFKKSDSGEPIEDNILSQVNTFLDNFSSANNPLTSNISIADMSLKAILEKLSLTVASNKVGLGSNNLLFIAAELLLLEKENYTGLKLTLIEEIEAHLHPQAQLRLIEFLQNELELQDKTEKVQLILTTHSPNLASKINLENLIICKNGKVFNMGAKHTKLNKGDYLFLERFLDVTKANLFFAEGVILVEGDAENLLIPTIAEMIDLPLAKYGISIVNVGSIAFLRYTKIFQRTNPENTMDIPVSVVTDCDVQPYKGHKDEDYEEAVEKKEKWYNEIPVKSFVSPSWTLEYVIALSSFQTDFYKAVLYAYKIKNSKVTGLTEDDEKMINEEVEANITSWKDKGWGNERIAFEIYQNIMLEKYISKAIVAQCFAKILTEYSNKADLKTQLLNDTELKYIINAIQYAASSPIEERRDV